MKMSLQEPESYCSDTRFLERVEHRSQDGRGIQTRMLVICDFCSDGGVVTILVGVLIIFSCLTLLSKQLSMNIAGHDIYMVDHSIEGNCQR